MGNEELGREIVRNLLDSTTALAESKALQDRLSHDLDICNHKLDAQNVEIATLKANLKGLGDVLENERRLNRDRQVDGSKLLDDKVNTIYKMVSIIATTISLVISFAHNFFK